MLKTKILLYLAVVAMAAGFVFFTNHALSDTCPNLTNMQTGLESCSSD